VGKIQLAKHRGRYFVKKVSEKCSAPNPLAGKSILKLPQRRSINLMINQCTFTSLKNIGLAIYKT
jgi:hypothetical protein